MAKTSTTTRPDAHPPGKPDPAALPTPPFENDTGLDALFFNTLDQYGSGFHVVVVKTAFDIGQAGLTACDETVPLATEDAHYENNFSRSTLWESDLAPYKPQCDVIVVADAHAPGGQFLPQFSVNLWVQAAATERDGMPVEGQMLIAKHLHITGPRQFERIGRPGEAWRLSPPQPLSRLPLRYEYAAGGSCMVKTGDDAATRVPQGERLPAPDPVTDALAYQVAQTNPVGLGFGRQWHVQATGIHTITAPQIDHPQRGFDLDAFNAALQTGGMPLPAGLGCIGRGWLPRRTLAGTVDARRNWDAAAVPGLPDDFDFGYWNCAPGDQQCRHLTGGERIVLSNLCPAADPACRLDGQGNHLLDFALPLHACALLIMRGTGGQQTLQVETLAIDTVLINVPGQRLELTWRICLPCDDTIDALRLLHADQPDQLARLEELRRFAAQAASPEAQ